MNLLVDIRKKLGRFSLNVKMDVSDEIFALLGGSGCGKSMTLKCIAGIVTPDAGHIEIDHRVVYDSSAGISLPPQKRRVGYMFQDYALFPNMTVRQNIMTGMGKKPPAERIEKYVRMFQLDGLESQYPAQLSGGQKQRVALARMLASEPEILLLDEPLSALDQYLKWQMEEDLLELLKSLHRPVIFVTHNRDEVYHLCDRVCVIQDGQVVTTQEKHDFFANPVTLAAARISGCRNFSAVRHLSDTELYAREWNMKLSFSEKVPDDITYVGIRAHYIEAWPAGMQPADEDGSCEEINTAVKPVDHLLEQQFESELVLSCGPGKENWLRLLMDKSRALQLSRCQKVKIHIPEEAILLLKENA